MYYKPDILRKLLEYPLRRVEYEISGVDPPKLKQMLHYNMLT